MNERDFTATINKAADMPKGKLTLIVILLMIAWQCFYTIQEGNVGILKRWGKAVEQVKPGLHFKVPFMENVETIEVRTRKNEETLPAASKEQMPLKVEVSVNWTVQSAFAMELFSKYGGLSQFEARIVDPRIRSAAKDAMAKYTAEELVVNRSLAIQDIETILFEEMKDFPVTMDSVQIENIILPQKYINSIEIKQTEKNLADAEEHKLRRQETTSRQTVNTAKADRDADMARADGQAYKVKVEADAQAHAIEVKGKAEAEAMTEKVKSVGDSKTLVEYVRAQNWNGVLPTTMMGSDQSVLWNMKEK